jgi:hypothetical protein
MFKSSSARYVFFFATPRHGGMFSDLILYQFDTLLRNVNLPPEQQHELTKVSSHVRMSTSHHPMPDKALRSIDPVSTNI